MNCLVLRVASDNGQFWPIFPYGNLETLSEILVLPFGAALRPEATFGSFAS